MDEKNGVDATELPSTLDRADLMELKYLQEHVQNRQMTVHLAQKELEEAVKGQNDQMIRLKGQYGIKDQDGINFSDGRILRKGDPGLRILNPNPPPPASA